MRPESEGDAVLVRAPAKVNLVLEVLGKRADGYHELEMANVLVSLHDEVRVRRQPDPGIRCSVDHPDIPTDGRNLAVRAAQRLVGEQGPGIAIDIRKRVPAGAGLAGGSSDAAATLIAVDALLSLGTPMADLLHIGAEIGSDVPFLLHGTAARCLGRGEIVEPQECPGDLALVIAWPRVALGTPEVFGALQPPLTPFKERASVLFALLRKGDGWSSVADQIFNRLETPARQLCPAVGATIDAMQSLGCQGVVMTGSGSAVVGLVPSLSEADRLAEALARRHACDTFAVTLVAN